MAISETLAIEAGLSDRVKSLLEGAIDLHCHSGPSIMPRDLDHIEAMKEASEAGLRAVMIKDHYYSATPVTELLNRNFAHLNVLMLSGVPLNNPTGGFNAHAIDHGVQLGAKLVWLPTFSAANHINAHSGRKEGFPTPIKPLLQPDPLSPLDANGKLRDDVKRVLDVVAGHDVVLAGGHLHVSEIFVVFEEAIRRGVKRLMVNHPSYIVDASLADVTALAGMGAYMEHSICMYAKVRPPSDHRFMSPSKLHDLIQAAGVDKTILGSDLGQVGNAHPVYGFARVIEDCLDLGYSDAQIRKLVSGNAAELVGLEPRKPA